MVVRKAGREIGTARSSLMLTRLSAARATAVAIDPQKKKPVPQTPPARFYGVPGRPFHPVLVLAGKAPDQTRASVGPEGRTER